MKRKIIKQGHNTLTITLPIKWSKNLNLKPGDEVTILERDNGLFLTAEKKDEILETEIDISGLDIPIIWKYFMAVYREGYDEIKVKFKPTELFDSPYKFYMRYSLDMKYGKKTRKHTPFEMLQEITNRFIGYEVLEHQKDYCIIKNMTEISSKEFDSSLRRVFFLINQMGRELIEALTSNNSSILHHTSDIDINLDKFHDYCVRVLNKTGFKDIRKSQLMFSTLFLLEMIGDEFKNISFHLIEDMKDKKFGNLLQLGQLTVDHFNKFYSLFYDFNQEKILEISKRDMEIYFYLPTLYKRMPGKGSQLNDNELEIFNHFRRIGKYINALVELRIEMEF